MALMVFCGINAIGGGALVVVQEVINMLMTNPVIAREGVYAASLLGASVADAGFKDLMFTVITPVSVCQYSG